MKAREKNKTHFILVEQDKAHLLGERRRGQGQMMQRQSLIPSHSQTDAQLLSSSYLGELLFVPLPQFLLLNMMLMW